MNTFLKLQAEALRSGTGFFATLGSILGHLGAFYLVAKLRLMIPRQGAASEVSDTAPLRPRNLVGMF